MYGPIVDSLDFNVILLQSRPPVPQVFESEITVRRCWNLLDPASSDLMVGMAHRNRDNQLSLLPC